MNLASIIDPHPDEQVALISRGRPTTYGDLRAQVAALRGGLQGLGIGPGDRVALLLSNKRWFVDAYLATIGLGAVVVPLNPASPTAEIASQLAVVRAAMVIVGPMAQGTFGAIDRSTIPTVEHVIACPGAEVEGAVDFDELLGAPAVPMVDVEPDQLAALLFTSGTAGSPRAAMLTHRNLLANIEQSRAASNRIGPDDVVYGVLPLFHIFGLNVVLGLSLAAGATVVLVQRFDPSTALDTIRERGVTIISGAPSMWVAWSQFTEAPADAFASVRLALSGAAKLPEDAARRLEARFGVRVREGYGLTEASPVVTSSLIGDPPYGSIGSVLPGVEVRLVDELGDDVLTGDSGELWVRGENVFAGYWDDPEATARVLTADGWLRTGDIGVVDDDGYLYLVDRAKDLIIVSGFNVFPAEVEAVLAEFPGVAEVAVVGVPHPHTGEAVKAFVVMEPGGDADEEQLIRFAQDHVARYKCPSKVLFVDELPHGTGGKLLRRSLR